MKMTCDCDLLCGVTCINRGVKIECGKNCRCGNRCQNNNFEKKNNAALQPFKTDSKVTESRQTLK